MNKRGFTLLEVIICLVIILSTIGIFLFSLRLQNNKYKILEKNINIIKNSASIYYESNNDFKESTKKENGYFDLSIDKLRDVGLIKEEIYQYLKKMSHDDDNYSKVLVSDSNTNGLIIYYYPYDESKKEYLALSDIKLQNSEIYDCNEIINNASFDFLSFNLKNGNTYAITECDTNNINYNIPGNYKVYVNYTIKDKHDIILDEKTTTQNVSILPKYNADNIQYIGKTFDGKNVDFTKNVTANFTIIPSFNAEENIPNSNFYWNNDIQEGRNPISSFTTTETKISNDQNIVQTLHCFVYPNYFGNNELYSFSKEISYIFDKQKEANIVFYLKKDDSYEDNFEKIEKIVQNLEDYNLKYEIIPIIGTNDEQNSIKELYSISWGSEYKGTIGDLLFIKNQYYSSNANRFRYIAINAKLDKKIYLNLGLLEDNNDSIAKYNNDYFMHLGNTHYRNSFTGVVIRHGTSCPVIYVYDSKNYTFYKFKKNDSNIVYDVEKDGYESAGTSINKASACNYYKSSNYKSSNLYNTYESLFNDSIELKPSNSNTNLEKINTTDMNNIYNKIVGLYGNKYITKYSNLMYQINSENENMIKTEYIFINSNSSGKMSVYKYTNSKNKNDEYSIDLSNIKTTMPIIIIANDSKEENFNIKSKNDKSIYALTDNELLNSQSETFKLDTEYLKNILSSQ